MKIRCITLFLPVASCLVHLALAAERAGYLTYDNNPLGTQERPLILRTYMPDPGLDDEVFANHGQGARSPRYNVGQGKDVGGEYQPVKGVPAAIGVNHGAALSYCFDTTECRLLYAWQGGFLDMYPYWGDRGRGSRQSFNYVPHLVGNLFYKTSGKHPLHLDGKSVSEIGAPQFIGYDLVDHIPVFQYRVGAHTVSLQVRPSDTSLTFQARFEVDPPAALSFQPAGAQIDAKSPKPGVLELRIAHERIANYQGFPRDLGVKEANADTGQKLYLQLGCIACHSTDGSQGHGPTFAALYGKTRPLEGGLTVTADETYLLESIKNPNAKTAEGYPPNYMPPYQLKDIEYQALVAFIKNLGQPE